MSGQTTVSVKISKELRKKMEELNVKPSEILKKAIENEVKRREVERIKESIKSQRLTIDKISIEEIVKGIREDRDTR
jgi:antitoxin CcdA